MQELKDKVAIITGGANGIGLATAKLFLAEGAQVMIVDIDTDALQEASTALDNNNLRTCRADVSKKSDTEKYVAATLDAFGGIDIFFNNAGIEGKVGPVTDYPEEEFDRIMAINVKGVWLGCQHALPKMRRGGSMVITSSLAGLTGFPGFGAYAASKHAIVGIMKVCAQENADRMIRVNSIHPGAVNTQMVVKATEQISQGATKEPEGGYMAQIPMGRYAEPEEVADLVLFLGSDRSKFITGQTHVIDGGMML
jgi:NAD(P)-dependent dehydrogenase (short-subunit alcohol dehydrogenase family)